MKTLRFIYAGNPDFAIFPLEALLRDVRFEVVSIVCGKDKKAGRGEKITSPPIAEFGKSNKLIVHQTDDIKKLEQTLKRENPDFMVVFAFGQILPKSILDIPIYGCINIHASLLPKYRGASPVQETLLNGDTKTGITFIKMNEKMDEGDILKMESLDIEENDNTQTLTEKLSNIGAKLLPQLMIEVSEGKLQLKKQNPAKTTYCRKIKKEDGRIDFSKETAEEIVRKIRAFTPWPSAYFFLDGKRIKILYATVDDEQKISSGKAEILNGEKMAIGTREGALYPLQIQQEGKKILSIKEFLMGYRGKLQIE